MWLQRLLKSETVRGRLFARFQHVEFDDGMWGMGYLETVSLLPENILLDWIDATLHISASQDEVGAHQYHARAELSA